MKPKIMMTTGVLTLTMFVSAGCGMYSRQAGSMSAIAPTSPIVADTTNRQIPLGTQLSIRTDVDIDAKKAGGTYEGKTTQAVVDENGHTLIPAGTPARLSVTEVSSGGATGTTTMELALRSLIIKGKTYAVRSSDEKESGREGFGKNARTAQALGGGALLGAILGAAFGAGPGAAIGAAAGAAAGTAGEILTRGKEVKVPAETVLKFRLNQPISVA